MPREKDTLSGILSDARKEILRFIKDKGEAGVEDVATLMEMTHEGARKHLLALEKEGWVSKLGRKRLSWLGRPTLRFSLTAAGEHLFPKQYDHLALGMVEAVAEQQGPEAVRGMLAFLADKQVALWAPRLKGKSLEEKLEILKAIYMENDPFVKVEKEGETWRLVESNCPYYNVAMKQPALCSLTVNVLSRLLGTKVTRVERFQSGDRRCAFVVGEEKTKGAGFRLESDP
jgi:DeoR family suf operon transcriptional repressor